MNFENFLFILSIVFINFFIVEPIIIKWQIKSNIDLFYALHKKEVERELYKNGK